MEIEELIKIYEKTGSCKKAGAVIGISHSTVHERLKKAGYRLKGQNFSEKDDAAIRDYYEKTSKDVFCLDVLSMSLNRCKHSLCRRARQLGLSDKNRERSDLHKARTSRGISECWRVNGHPRGALGLIHTDQTKKVLGEKSKAAWAIHKKAKTGYMSDEARQIKSDRMMNSQANGVFDVTKQYSRSKSGYRDDLGKVYFRSAWEANYARYLNFLIKNGDVEWWEYEPDTFWFEAIKRGVRSYKPDFKVKFSEKNSFIYIEIKGWMDAKSKTKIKRMAKYHPDVTLEVFGAKEYKSLKKQLSGVIENWE